MPQKHQGHSFRLIENKPTHCYCGDHSHYFANSFCPLHQRAEKEEIKIEMEGKFIEEMQFAIFLFLKITQIKGHFTDDSKKK